MATAIVESNEALDTMNRLQQAAQDALAGKPISIGTDWSKLADRYDKAARDAKSAPLPAAIPQTEPVSVEDLRKCTTRAEAIHKLTNYLTDLRASQSSGQELEKTLDKQLANIQHAKQALAYLITVHEKLMALPVVGTSFGLDWVDLNTRVSDSLAGLDDALKGNRKRTDEALSTLSIKIRNYESNLSLINTLPHC
jgi:hypothetical protein